MAMMKKTLHLLLVIPLFSTPLQAGAINMVEPFFACNKLAVLMRITALQQSDLEAAKELKRKLPEGPLY